MARRIALYNCEAIYYVKNSLIVMSPEIMKKMSEEHEKMITILSNNWPDVRPELLVANYKDNENHDILKLDIDAITDVLLEEKNDNDMD